MSSDEDKEMVSASENDDCPPSPPPSAAVAAAATSSAARAAKVASLDKTGNTNNNKGQLGMVGYLSGMFNMPSRKYKEGEEAPVMFDPGHKRRSDGTPMWQGQCRGGSLRLCGHALHERCYIEYRLSVMRGNPHLNRANGLYNSTTEFLCPLCKSISNVAIPIQSETTEATPSDAKNSVDDAAAIVVDAATGSLSRPLPSFNAAAFDALLEQLAITGDSLPDFVSTGTIDVVSAQESGNFLNALKMNMAAVRTVPKLPYTIGGMFSASSESFATMVNGDWLDGNMKSVKDHQAPGFLSLSEASEGLTITPVGGASALVFRLSDSRLLPKASSPELGDSEDTTFYHSVSTARQEESAMLAATLSMACNPSLDDDRAYSPSFSVVPPRLSSVFLKYPFVAVVGFLGVVLRGQYPHRRHRRASVNAKATAKSKPKAASAAAAKSKASAAETSAVAASHVAQKHLLLLLRHVVFPHVRQQQLFLLPGVLAHILRNLLELFTPRFRCDLRARRRITAF